MQAVSLLDYEISVPIDKRTPFKTIAALCDAVSKAAGVKLVASSPELRGIDRLFSKADEPQISWGTISANARSALIDILRLSATSLSWRLNCQPSAQPEDRFCVLNISPILISVIENGEPVRDILGVPLKKAIEYDR